MQFVLVTEKSETNPRAWVGELLKVRGNFAFVRYCKPETPERLRDCAMIVRVPIEDVHEWTKK